MCQGDGVVVTLEMRDCRICQLNHFTASLNIPVIFPMLRLVWSRPGESYTGLYIKEGVAFRGAWNILYKAIISLMGQMPYFYIRAVLYLLAFLADI